MFYSGRVPSDFRIVIPYVHMCLDTMASTTCCIIDMLGHEMLKYRTKHSLILAGCETFPSQHSLSLNLIHTYVRSFPFIYTLLHLTTNTPTFVPHPHSIPIPTPPYHRHPHSTPNGPPRYPHAQFIVSLCPSHHVQSTRAMEQMLEAPESRKKVSTGNSMMVER